MTAIQLWHTYSRTVPLQKNQSEIQMQNLLLPLTLTVLLTVPDGYMRARSHSGFHSQSAIRFGLSIERFNTDQAKVLVK